MTVDRARVPPITIPIKGIGRTTASAVQVILPDDRTVYLSRKHIDFKPGYLEVVPWYWRFIEKRIYGED